MSISRLTDAEVHQAFLVDVFDALKDATAALADGDKDLLEISIAEAGFAICCALPKQYSELAPDLWHEKGC
jgi:hypothetical protein